MLIAIICGLVAVIYGALLIMWLLKLPAGDEKMREVAGAVQEGAKAYLNRQYRTIAMVGVVVFVILLVALGLAEDWTYGWHAAVGFIVGAVLSASAGYIGMMVSVRVNVRTAEAAQGGLAPALKVAFRGGSVTGLLVVGFALLGVTVYYSITGDVAALVGLGFGGSLISVFARVGGGIYTKAADVGADLVGKVEAGIPEDDPRNPAVIADNVGDNVGDCAGMAADLFETYAVTAVAAMLLAHLFFPQLHRRGHVSRSCSAASPSSPASSAPSSCAWAAAEHHERPLQGPRRGGRHRHRLVLSDHPLDAGRHRGRPAGMPSVPPPLLGAVTGVVVTALIVVITEFFTATHYSPVKSIAKASVTGHATNIIQGLAIGMQATALPVIVIAAGILGATLAGAAPACTASPWPSWRCSP